MYAIIQSGSQQFRVEKGTKLMVEKLEQEAGSQFEISQVLLVSGENGDAKIGQPYVSGGKVSAKVVRHLRAPKVIIFRKQSKKGFKKIKGHRQSLTEIEIQEISA